MFDIIIPTYNERENIKPLFILIQRVFKELDRPYNIVLVDDSSPDGTYDEAVRLRHTVSATLLKRAGKQGLGTAYKAALAHCVYDFVIVLDADLSHCPGDIRGLIEKMEISATGESKYDVVAASRYMKNGGVVGWSLMRKVTSRGANNLAQVLLGLEHSDLTGSFRIYRRGVFDALTDKVQSTGYAYQMEIMYLAVKNDLRVAEVPIIFYERAAGVSKLGLWEVFNYVKILLRLFIFD